MAGRKRSWPRSTPPRRARIPLSRDPFRGAAVGAAVEEVEDDALAEAATHNY
jgi:hypothetical protein